MSASAVDFKHHGKTGFVGEFAVNAQKLVGVVRFQIFQGFSQRNAEGGSNGFSGQFFAEHLTEGFLKATDDMLVAV